MPVEIVHNGNIAEVEAFLKRHEDTTQFLLANLRTHGSRLSEHENSGNMKLIRAGGLVCGVFEITRRGVILLQAEPEHAGIILADCVAERIPITGFIGEWASVEPVYRKCAGFRATYESREILYRLLLVGNLRLGRDARVRFLIESDFAEWSAFRTEYLSELRLPENLSPEQVHSQFINQARDRIWWGLFSGGKLVSRAGLNAIVPDVGQVGGVFTPPALRKRGFSKAVMLHMLMDCREIHGHSKSILFTGETDVAARKLYESIGYAPVGEFALIFGAAD